MLAAIAGVFFAGSPTAQATNYYWDTSSGTFSTGTNWSTNSAGSPAGNTAPSTSSDTATFNGSAVTPTNEIISFTAAATVGTITFNNTDTTSLYSSSTTAETLTLGPSSGTTGITIASTAGAVTIGNSTDPLNVALAVTQTWTNNSTANTFKVLNSITGTATTGNTQTLTIAGAGNTTLGAIGNGTAGGTVALTVGNSAGTVTLASATTYTGATTVGIATTLSLNAAMADDASDIKLQGSGTGALLTETVANGLSGTGYFTVTNASTVTLPYSNNNTVTSFLNGTGSTLNIGNNGSLGTGTSNKGGVTLGLGTLEATTTLSGVTGYLGLQGSGTGTGVIGGTNSIVFSGPIVATSGGIRTVTVNNSALTSFTGGSFTDQQALVMDGTGNVTVGDVISGGILSYSGTGTLTLSGANTYTGGLTVNSGTVTVTGSTATLEAAAGTLAVNNTNTTAAGTATVVNLSTTAATTTGSLSGTISTPTSGTNTATINNGGQTYTVNQTTAGTYAGVIAGVGGLTLGSSSTSTLTLSGANTYSGATTVNAGALALTNAGAISGTTITGGTLTGTTSVSVGSAGTLMLSANNTVNPAATVSLGGGTITVAAGVLQGQGATPNGVTPTQSSIAGFGALTLTANSTLNYSGNSGTVVFTSFTPNGNSLNVTGSNFDTSGNGGTDSTNDRLIFTTDQSANLGDFEFNGVPGNVTEVALTAGGFEIEMSPVPEPATWAAGLLMVGAVGWRQRRSLRSLAEVALRAAA